MDGIFLIALLGIAGLTGALLGLCVKLRGDTPAPGSDHGGPHGQEALVKHSAADRGL